MIPPELARVRLRAGELVLTELNAAERARAQVLAAELAEILRGHVGKPRSELEQAALGMAVEPTERALFAALEKLACDRCEFESADGPRAAAVRASVFTAAAASRKELGAGQSLDRERVLAAVAAEQGLTVAQLEAELYADLRGMERLLRVPELRPESLLEEYELARVQAVLLRAVKVRAEVSCASPAAYRALFGKLKFRRLLYEVTRGEGDRYVLDIDGPFSLFESVTKYGLALALILPALLECQTLELSADVRWGAKRQPATFRLKRRGGTAGAREPALADDVAALIDGFRQLGSDWTVEPAAAILDLPGSGVCIPDLVFTHRSGQRVFLELMGYWSRDAVWRRVELVRAGLTEPVVFAVSSKLRVSEAVLDDGADSALYVYKATASPRAVLSRLELLRGRAQGKRSPRARRARDTPP